MFVARERELSELEGAYRRPGLKCVIVYGRRRVGKTRLLNEFVRGKQNVHFLAARDTNARENLVALSRAVLTEYDPADPLATSNPAVPTFSGYDAALAHAFEEAREHPTILVLDEYPYLAKSYPGVSSLLQHLIDANQAADIMVILCGSSMSFMEHQVLGEKSPLYGRRTSQITLQPFDFADAARMLQTEDVRRAIELYSLVGGVPLYLQQLDARRSTEWNVAHAMLGAGSYLYEEPLAFLLQEVTSPQPYASVIEALAQGHPRPQEIADATGLPASNVIGYLKKLAELGIVARETPVGHAKRRQVVYRLSDNLFRFWYSFVPRYQSAIELGATDQVAHRIAKGELETYQGHAFEVVCRQWLLRAVAQGDFDILPVQVGRWWGTDPASREQADVDLVALGADGELVACECKWTSKPVGADVVDLLAHRAALVTDDPSRTDLVVFSKAGFMESAHRTARERGNVRLVEAKEMLRVGEGS